MTVFNKTFLFLDNPNGGVENLSEMKAAGFSGVFCNVHAFPAEAWEAVVRPRALALGMFCGPWARIDSAGQEFKVAMLDHVINIADRWDSPLTINAESELKGTGATATLIIAAKVGSRDAAVSMEPWLFANVDWTPIAHLPMLLQMFPIEQPLIFPPGSNVVKQTNDCKIHAWESGIKCVYFTFGTYGGMKPTDFNLQHPYSLFTGDAMRADYMPWSPTSVGYVACKVTPPTGGNMVPLTPEQVPYTGPYGLATGTFKSKGPTAEAAKRAMGHLKFMPWRDYDQQWNLALWEAFADWKKSVGLPHDGSYGEKAWIKLRAATYKKNGATLYALDPYARELIQNEASRTAQSTDEEKVQEALAEWGNIIISNEPNIGYDMGRPVQVNVDPNTKFDSDCSGTVIQAYAYAKRKTNLRVPDPSKQGWTGYGNTDWYEDDHRKVGGPYRIGDLAHFHSSRHVIMCIKPGDYKTAEWVSHGREAGPERLILVKYNRYPSEFMFVVRPPLLEV